MDHAHCVGLMRVRHVRDGCDWLIIQFCTQVKARLISKLSSEHTDMVTYVCVRESGLLLELLLTGAGPTTMAS